MYLNVILTNHISLGIAIISIVLSVISLIITYLKYKAEKFNADFNIRITKMNRFTGSECVFKVSIDVCNKSNSLFSIIKILYLYNGEEKQLQKTSSSIDFIKHVFLTNYESCNIEGYFSISKSKLTDDTAKIKIVTTRGIVLRELDFCHFIEKNNDL